MCGIWCLLGELGPLFNVRQWIDALVPRGPEQTEVLTVSDDVTLGFTRLAINGCKPEGMQPFRRETAVWMCNGEIYNHELLKEQYNITDVKSGSDCEVIGSMYEKLRDNLKGLFRSFDGVFAMTIVDLERGRVIVARDPYGVRPLFTGFGYKYQPIGMPVMSSQTFNMDLNHVIFASEVKALIPICVTVQPFLPGTYQVWDIHTKKLLVNEKYHTVPILTNPMLTPTHPNGLEMACASLRYALEEAVEKRMMTERPVAALLSGGIDSSLIASLVQRNLRNLGLPPLKTFSIGMKGSSDLAYARKVADWIGSDHNEIIVRADDFFRAIPRVILNIESYDTTTVRASVGNWLVSKYIKENSDCKVVFNGDGSDEVFGSYLYFNYAPNNREFEEEVERLLTDMHYFDVLRSDRSISSNGLEPRTPFLDKQFVGVARSIATEWRRPIQGIQVEKWILRRAFDDNETLPHEVLWRRKEAFSDGVSSSEKSWYQEIQDRVQYIVPPDWQEIAKRNYTYLVPQTPEQYYYRFLFEAAFGKHISQMVIPYFWMPKWIEGATDPSARTLEIYNQT
jgi:asparagine synthase (glutamine-hydrolysing)